MWFGYIFINKSSSGLGPGFIDRFKLLIVSGERGKKKTHTTLAENRDKCQ